MPVTSAGQDFLRWRGEIEKLPHLRRGSGRSRQLSHSQTFEHQAKNALMPIKRGGLIVALSKRADDYGRNSPSAICLIVPGLVEHQHEQPVLLELRTLDQWIDIHFQPPVRHVQAAIVCIVTPVRSYEAIVRQCAVSEIPSELRQGHDIGNLTLSLGVFHIREWGMPRIKSPAATV